MLKKNKSFIVFIIFAILSALWGFLLTPGDELFYSIFIQYLLLPLLTLICSIIGVKNGTAFGWTAPAVYAGITVALPFLVFGTTDVAFAVFALVPAILGYIIGGICYSVKNY